MTSIGQCSDEMFFEVKPSSRWSRRETRTSALDVESLFLSDWYPTRWDDSADINGTEYVAELVPVWLRGDEEIFCTHVLYLVGKQKLNRSNPFISVGENTYKIVNFRYKRGFKYKGKWRVWYTELRLTGPKIEDYDDPRWPWAAKWKPIPISGSDCDWPTWT